MHKNRVISIRGRQGVHSGYSPQLFTRHDKYRLDCLFVRPLKITRSAYKLRVCYGWGFHCTFLPARSLVTVHWVGRTPKVYKGLKKFFVGHGDKLIIRWLTGHNHRSLRTWAGAMGVHWPTRLTCTVTLTVICHSTQVAIASTKASIVNAKVKWLACQPAPVHLQSQLVH